MEKMTCVEPCLIIGTGIAGTGKSTVLQELAKQIPNAFILDKDVMNQSCLHIPIQEFSDLPPLVEHLKTAHLTLEDQDIVDSPFGLMYQLPSGNSYYYRFVRNQVYITMTAIAQHNLRLNKVPIIDCMVINDIRTGALKRFMNIDRFAPYPKFLIHFVVDEAEGYHRLVERAKYDHFAAARDQSKIATQDSYHHFITKEQPMIPPELSSYKHLLLDTSKGTTAEHVRQCYEYILQSDIA